MKKVKKVKVGGTGYAIMRPFLKFLLMTIFHPKIVGAENIPKNGAIILAGNHKSYVDPFMVGSGTKRVVHFLAKRELHDNKLFGWFFTFLGTVPVDRKHKDQNAKDKSLEILKAGEVYAIFPEGTRNKTKDIIMPFRFGAVSFASKTNTKIVPFAITGNYCFRSKDLQIEYGKPIDIKDMDLESANKLLEKKVIELLQKNK